MTNITNYLNKVKTAVYGKDVRGAIHDAIKQVYDDASVEHDNANMEVKLARGTHNTLNDRLDNVDEIQAQTNAQLLQISINVKSFGAKGDGVNDDTNSIKLALESISEVGGGTILFPPGVYLWSEELTIYENTTLQLNPNTIIKRNHNGSFMCNGVKGYNYAEPYSAYGNIIIDGGLWDGNTNRQQNGYNMINIGKGDNIIIRNAIFKDYSGGHVLDISGCRNVLIDNCKFIGFRPTTDREFAEAIQLAEHTEMGFSSFSGWDYSPCENIIIQNCYFGKSGTLNTVGVNGIGGHSSTHDIFNQNIKILNNTFEDAHYAAIRSFKWKNVLIDGNTFNRCERGIALSNVVGGSLSSHDKNGNQTNKCQSGRDITIINNTLDRCGTNSIYASGQASVVNGFESYDYIKNVVIHNNMIKNSVGENCLSLILCQDMTISGNYIENVQRAFRLLYNSRVKIFNNTVDTCVSEGLYFYESTAVFPLLNGRKFGNDLTLDGNIFMNIGNNGVFIQELARGIISNNYIKNVSTSHCGDNARSGMLISTNSEDLIVKGNHVIKSEGSQNKYGIEVTTTCSNIIVYENDCYGVSKSLSVSQNALRSINNTSTNKWIDCDLANGVTPHSTFKVQFMKNIDGMVTITGAVTHDKNFTGTLFTLPEGFRPRQTAFYITNNSMGGSDEVKLSRIKVTYTGEVVLESSNTISDIPFTSVDIIFYT